jgi:hypothetical protein
MVLPYIVLEIEGAVDLHWMIWYKEETNGTEEIRNTDMSAVLVEIGEGG